MESFLFTGYETSSSYFSWRSTELILVLVDGVLADTMVYIETKGGIASIDGLPRFIPALV